MAASAVRKQHLAGAPPVVRLPADGAGPAGATWRAVPGGIPLDQGTQPAVLAVAALAALLHRHTGATELLLGLQRPAEPGQALMLRLAVNPLESAGELLTDAAEALATAVELGPVAVDWLRETRGGDTPPCHGVVVSGDLDTGLPALAELALVTNGEQVAVATVAGLFTAAAEQALLAQADLIVHALVSQPGCTVDTLPLLDDAGRARQWGAWAEVADAVPAGYFHELVAEHAARRPDAVALVQGDRKISYGLLEASANRLAHHLAGLDVRAEGRVGVCLERGAANLVSQLAVFKLGAAVVLLDPEYPADRLAFMCEDAGVTAVITREGVQARVLGDHAVVRFDADDWRSQPTTPVQVPVTDDTVCQIGYASGSTGLPTGVLLRHGPLRGLLHGVRRRCGIHPGARGTWLVPPGLGLVQVDCFPVLAAGGEVHVPAPTVAATPAQLRDWLLARRITHALLLTAVGERIWALDWPADTALRNLRVVGGPPASWPPAELPFHVIGLYGSAETTAVAACDLTTVARSLTDAQRAVRRPPIGRPLPNVRAYVLDADRQPVPAGVLGDLLVSGPGLSQGYLNRPEVTTATFLDNPIPGDPNPVLCRTGDVARYWPDGTIEVVGRTGNDVRITGYRAQLREVRRRDRLADDFLMHPDHVPAEGWIGDAVAQFRERMLSTESLFPCIFGVDAVRRATLRYTFVPAGPFRGLWLSEALKCFVDHAPDLGRRTSLVAFFEHDQRLRTHDDFRNHFWDLLSELHGYDEKPWPRGIAADPDSALWEFSFHDMPLFVVANTPTHSHRQSRNFPYFAVTFQPRFVFDDLAEDSPQGGNARKIIRDRLRRYDTVPAAPVLSGYGQPDSREWIQYFLHDDNRVVPRQARCPFHSRVSSEENTDDYGEARVQ